MYVCQKLTDVKKLLRVEVNGTPKSIVVLRDDRLTRSFEAHPLVEKFNAERGTNCTVISHKVADIALAVPEIYMGLPVFPVDASIAYEKPGTKLKKEIVFSAKDGSRIILATGKYKGEKDVALVALGLSSKDFKQDGNSIILNISEDRLILVPNFPRSPCSGWYVQHPETDVPHREKINTEKMRPNQKDRHLHRSKNSSYVGLLVRSGYHSDCFAPPVVDAYYARSSDCFRVVMEVPEKDLQKLDLFVRI